MALPHNGLDPDATDMRPNASRCMPSPRNGLDPDAIRLLLEPDTRPNARWRPEPAEKNLLEWVFEREKKPSHLITSALASALHVDQRRVIVWFQNRRQRRRSSSTSVLRLPAESSPPATSCRLTCSIGHGGEHGENFTPAGDEATHGEQHLLFSAFQDEARRRFTATEAARPPGASTTGGAAPGSRVCWDTPHTSARHASKGASGCPPPAARSMSASAAADAPRPHSGQLPTLSMGGPHDIAPHGAMHLDTPHSAPRHAMTVKAANARSDAARAAAPASEPAASASTVYDDPSTTLKNIVACMEASNNPELHNAMHLSERRVPNRYDNPAHAGCLTAAALPSTAVDFSLNGDDLSLSLENVLLSIQASKNFVPLDAISLALLDECAHICAALDGVVSYP